MKHVGIVACSAEGAALCYRSLVHEGARTLGEYAHPEISMHSLPLARYVECIERGDWRGVSALMLESARKLEAIGADFLLCPDNTIHQALPALQAESPLPWLHIAEVVAEEAQRRGFVQVGILGTRWLVESEVYPAALQARGLGWRRPTPEERDTGHGIIMGQLVKQVFLPEAEVHYQAVMRRMKDEGCDAVVLGCTEIPLVMHEGNSPLPILDSTRLLASAALRHATQGS